MEIFLICSFKRLRSKSSSSKPQPVPEAYYRDTLCKLKCSEEDHPQPEQNSSWAWMMVSVLHKQARSKQKLLAVNHHLEFQWASLSEHHNEFVLVPDCEKPIFPEFLSYHALSWENIVCIVTEQGTLFYSKTNSEVLGPRLTYLCRTDFAAMPKNYLGMSSPNFARNCTITVSGLLVVVSGTKNGTLAIVDLKRLSKQTKEAANKALFDACFTIKTSAGNIGEVTVVENGDILYLTKYHSSKLYQFSSRYLRQRPSELQIGDDSPHNQDNERYTALAIPTQTTDQGKLYRKGTYLTGKISNPSHGTALVTTLHDMKTGVSYSEIDVISGSQGCGPLHSIREIRGSRGTLFLVSCDETFSHLLGSYNLQLQLIQEKIEPGQGQTYNIISGRVNTGCFWMYTTSANAKQPIRFDLVAN